MRSPDDFNASWRDLWNKRGRAIREPYMELVVQMVMFLELSDAAIVDEDAAVAMMEQIVVTLQHLDVDERRKFIEFCAERAASATSAGERHLLDRLPDVLGLTP